MSSAACCARRICSRPASSLERGELTPVDFKRIEDRAVDEAVALQEAGRARRRHRRRDAALRVLRPSGRRARGLRQVRRLVDHVQRRRRARGGAEAPGRRRQAALAPADERRGVHLPARPDDAAGQGDAAQRAAGRGLLRSRPVEGGVRRRATPTSPTSWTSPAARSPSWRGSAASTSRSTRRSTPRCSTRRSARATASAAAIPTACSTPASSSTTRSSTAIPA